MAEQDTAAIAPDATAEPVQPRIDFARQVQQYGLPTLSVGLIFVVWEIAARAEIVQPFLLPKFSEVVLTVVADIFGGPFFENAALTLYRAFTAFLIAAVIGVPLGILIARVRGFRWFFDPILSVMMPMPKFALLPIFMLWFGLLDGSKITMAAFTVVFQIVIATWAATQSVDNHVIWSAQSLGASRRRMLWEIILPAALPEILTGLQIAFPICLIVILAVEFITSGGGLGNQMIVAARYADSPGTFAGLIEMALVGFAVLKAMEYLRKKLLKWHQETLQVVN